MAQQNIRVNNYKGAGHEYIKFQYDGYNLVPVFVEVFLYSLREGDFNKIGEIKRRIDQKAFKFYPITNCALTVRVLGYIWDHVVELDDKIPKDTFITFKKADATYNNEEQFYVLRDGKRFGQIIVELENDPKFEYQFFCDSSVNPDSVERESINSFIATLNNELPSKNIRRIIEQSVRRFGLTRTIKQTDNVLVEMANAQAHQGGPLFEFTICCE